MRIRAWALCLGTMGALVGCSSAPASTPAPSTPPPVVVQGLETSPTQATGKPTHAGTLSGKTVVVDAGHAGLWTKDDSGRLITTYGDKRLPCYTAGATAPDGTAEHTVNFDLAKRVGALLQADGATVVMTRADDATLGPCNNERGHLANTTKADALVALHADFDSDDKRGFHLIYSPDMRGGQRVQTASVTLATHLSDALHASPLPPANYKGTAALPLDPRTNMAVLNELSRTRGVLVEIGNLNNPADWAAIAQPGTRDALAAAIAQGIRASLA